jgi:hypothetical protein
MKRIVLLLAAAALASAAHAQTVFVQSGAQPALDVQRLAPQLIAFAGGDVNFQNLVNGLALGVPVTLTSTIAPGQTQVVTFTPTGTMTPLQIAQVLENARQSLIARGIATPTAQQLATALVGGALPTALGATQVSGVVQSSTTVGTTTQMSPAAALQQNTMAPNAAAGASAARSNMSDSALPRGVSDTPPLPVPGVTTGPGTTAGATGTTTTAAPAGALTPAPAATSAGAPVRTPVFGAR